ncbi:MAG: recombinase family protein [Rhodospirillales bacterium]|nr:recombinase family protein [Rhodospirillales bacterium]
MDGKFVSYLRVSTDRQGRSGLGLEAQREAVSRFLNGGSWRLLGEFVEVESGRANERPQLAAALNQCRLTGATLVVAKLDRLARNARFLLSVVEGSGEGGVIFCDLPRLPPGPVGKFMVTQMAAVAELEAGLIGQRTKDALAEARRRGVKLGGYRGGPKADHRQATAARQEAAASRAGALGPLIGRMREQGLSLREIAAELQRQGIQTPRDGAWTAAGVRAILLRSSGEAQAPVA